MARAQPRAWSQQQDELLQDDYRAGVVLRDMAANLGCEVHHVVSRIQALRRAGVELGPRRARWTREQRLLLARLRREGYSLRELELEFERSRGTITRQLRTLRRLGYDLGDDEGALARTGRRLVRP